MFARASMESLAQQFMQGHMPPPAGSPAENTYFDVLLSNMSAAAETDPAVHDLYMSVTLLAGMAPAQMDAWMLAQPK